MVGGSLIDTEGDLEKVKNELDYVRRELWASRSKLEEVRGTCSDLIKEVNLYKKAKEEYEKQFQEHLANFQEIETVQQQNATLTQTIRFRDNTIKYLRSENKKMVDYEEELRKQSVKVENLEKVIKTMSEKRVTTEPFKSDYYEQLIEIAETKYKEAEKRLSEALDKVEALKKVARRLGDQNHKMIGELLALQSSRQRLLIAVPEMVAAKESMQTQLDKAALTEPVETRYPEFFKEEP